MRTALAGFHLEGNGGSWNPGAGGDGWSGGGGGCGGGCGCGGSCGGDCGCKGAGGFCGGKPWGGSGDRPSDGGGSPGGGSGQLPLIPDYDGEIWSAVDEPAANDGGRGPGNTPGGDYPWARPLIEDCCETCQLGTKELGPGGVWEETPDRMETICGIRNGDIIYEGGELGRARRCDVPCPGSGWTVPCLSSDPLGIMGGAPFDPIMECCEGGLVVRKVVAYVVSRESGSFFLGIGGHADLLLPQLDGTGGYRMLGFFGRGFLDIGFFGFGLTGYVNESYVQWSSEAVWERRQTMHGADGQQLSEICALWVCPSRVRGARKLLRRCHSEALTFNISGTNCSTVAAGVLGIDMNEGVFGTLDTPHELIALLKKRYRAICFMGYTRVGPDSNATIEPAVGQPNAVPSLPFSLFSDDPEVR